MHVKRAVSLVLLNPRPKSYQPLLVWWVYYYQDRQHIESITYLCQWHLTDMYSIMHQYFLHFLYFYYWYFFMIFSQNFECRIFTTVEYFSIALQRSKYSLLVEPQNCTHENIVCQRTRFTFCISHKNILRICVTLQRFLSSYSTCKPF